MSTATILLVEDNPITRKLVRFTLEARGLSVVDAPDGGSALRTFELQPISLVLQDLVLPDLDGFELVSRLRKLPGGADVPILAFSGLLSKPEEARVSAAGFDDLISKPIEPSRLLQIIEAHLPPSEPRSGEMFGRGRKLVVVDDDPVQRKLACFRLKKVGFEVIPAADGVEALELARTTAPPPDAIVSDVLMPRLDGFGLCMELRRDPRLSAVPIILTTNSYVESADRDLARKAGATDLVLRTPELSDVLDKLRVSLGPSAPKEPPRSVPSAELNAERILRVMRQLERQVALNAGVSQRCALLSAEISVLNGISEALATQESTEEALKHALAACFDAGGISLGALYLLEHDGFRVLGFGSSPLWNDERLKSFFGEPALFEEAMRQQTALAIPSAAVPEDRGRKILQRAGASSLLVVPLGYKGQVLGMMLMVSTTLDLHADERRLFGQAVAGQISQALAVARAFADKQASERRATEQAAVLRSILESIAEGVVVANAGGNVIHWNPAAEALLGGGPLDGHIHEWASRYLPLGPDKVTPVAPDQLPLARAVRGEPIDGEELFLRRSSDGQGIWLNVTARPLKSDSGALGGGVSAFRDVTREKAAQAQLMVSDRMASVGMLAAGVGHEINNPLSAVLANLDLARHDLAERAAHAGDDLQEVREMLDDARNAAEQVRQIVRDLRIFSRHEDARSRPVNVEQVMESSLRMAWNEIRHRARLVKDYGNVPLVEASDSRLGQVFLNLLVNAAQAIPAGNVQDNVIRVVTRAEGERVLVEVSDTGCGIAADTLRQLFTPFFTTKAPGVGTGLGLAICHRIVTGLGGDIVVDSQLGKGTTFRVLLPLARATEDGESLPESLPEPSQRRARVLVIDDEPMVGTAVRRLLASEHDITLTTAASEALALLRAGEQFDVVLCDLMMPQMTGMELYEEVKATDPELAERIIFLTGGAFTPAARAFLDQVPNQRMEKPFEPQHLRALVADRVRPRLKPPK